MTVYCIDLFLKICALLYTLNMGVNLMKYHNMIHDNKPFDSDILTNMRHDCWWSALIMFILALNALLQFITLIVK